MYISTMTIYTTFGMVVAHHYTNAKNQQNNDESKGYNKDGV